MTFRHLSIFVAVCDEGTMTAAAEKLFIAQPSVSQAISELESNYGVRLFERLGRRLYITTAGEKLLSYARHILNLAEQAQQELRRLVKSGVIRLGASITIGTCLLGSMVQSFLCQYPDVEIMTTVDNTKIIEELLLTDRIDLGLVEGPIHSDDIVEAPFSSDKLVLICPPEHPLAVKGKAVAADLNNAAFIMRERGSGTREVFEAALASAGLKWRTTGTYNNTEAIKNAVAKGLGIAVISCLTVEKEVQSVELAAVEIDGLSLSRKFNLISHKNKFFTQAMLDFKKACLSDKLLKKQGNVI